MWLVLYLREFYTITSLNPSKLKYFYTCVNYVELHTIKLLTEITQSEPVLLFTNPQVMWIIAVVENCFPGKKDLLSVCFSTSSTIEIPQ